MKYTHLVRSLNLAGDLITTLHESWEAACEEQIHRLVDCQHRDVVVMPVAEETIELPRGGAVVAYRPGAYGTRKVGPETARRKHSW